MSYEVIQIQTQHLFQPLETLATIHGLSPPELQRAWIQTGGPKRSLRHCLRDAGYNLLGQNDMGKHEEVATQNW